MCAGTPPPQLNWWREHALIDGSYDHEDGHKTVNTILIENLQRTDLHSILTCQASNNNISNPVSSSVKIDMHCRTCSVLSICQLSLVLFSRATERESAGQQGLRVCWQEIRGSLPSCWGATSACRDLVERNSSDQGQHHHHCESNGQWQDLSNMSIVARQIDAL